MERQVDTVKVDDRGRLIIPIHIRKSLGVKPGDVFYIRSDKDGLHIVKSENPFDALMEDAIAQFDAGKTLSAEQVAKELGIVDGNTLHKGRTQRPKTVKGKRG